MAIARSLPARNLDNTTGNILPSRTGAYLEAYSLPLGSGDYYFADEGSFFMCTNATLATGIAGHAAPVVADTDTKALLHVYNGGTKNIIPVFLQMEVTAAGTAGTLHYSVVYVDNKGSTALSSGGTAITPVNTNSAGSSATGATVTFGACVLAMTSSKKVYQMIVREVIPVVQDTMFIRFAAPNGEAHSSLTTAGTATCHTVQHVPPVVIAPGGNFNFAQIRPSQSAAASYQFNFGYIER